MNKVPNTSCTELSALQIAEELIIITTMMIILSQLSQSTYCMWITTRAQLIQLNGVIKP